MNKTVLATLALAVTAVGMAQYPVMSTTFAGGVRDAAMDSKGNLFIVNGSGTAFHRISATGQSSWVRNDLGGLVSYSKLMVGGDGTVLAPCFNPGGFAMAVLANGWSGTQTTSGVGDPFAGQEILALATGDANYMAFRNGQNVYLTIVAESSSRVLLNSSGDSVVLAADPNGGVVVGARSSTQSVRKFNSSLVEQWSRNLYNISPTASSPLKIMVRADGHVLSTSVSPTGQALLSHINNVGNTVTSTLAQVTTVPSQDGLNAPFFMGGNNFMVGTQGIGNSLRVLSMVSDTGMSGSSTDSVVIPYNGRFLAIGDSIKRYDHQNPTAVDHGNWTKPASSFLTFVRPDGQVWVVEKSATNASIQRLAFGPRTVSDTFVMDEDAAARTFSLTTNDTNYATSGGLTVSYGTLPNETFGAVSNNGTDGQFTFTPTANASGTYEFWYRVTDANNDQSVWTRARVIVRAINDRPVGVTESYNVAAGQTLTVNQTNQGVLNNDTDVENSPLTAHVWRQPRAGQLTLNTDGTFDYVAPSTPGVYTFQYRAQDASLFSFPVTVQINVQ